MPTVKSACPFQPYNHQKKLWKDRQNVRHAASLKEPDKALTSLFFHAPIHPFIQAVNNSLETCSRHMPYRQRSPHMQHAPVKSGVVLAPWQRHPSYWNSYLSRHIKTNLTEDAIKNVMVEDQLWQDSKLTPRKIRDENTKHFKTKVQMESSFHTASLEIFTVLVNRQLVLAKLQWKTWKHQDILQAWKRIMEMNQISIYLIWFILKKHSAWMIH